MSPRHSKNGNGSSNGAIARGNRAIPAPPAQADDANLAELQSLREELELQSKQLILGRQLLEQSRERYADLYDFAPVPYFVLDGVGTVVEVNLTGASFLETERARIVGFPLRRFVVFGDRPVFLEHMRLCRSQRGRVTSVVRIAAASRKVMHVQITSRRSLQMVDGVPSYPTLLTDLTERENAVSARDLLLTQLINAQEEERSRLSRELHDEMGQHVTALILGLRSMAASQPHEKEKLERLLAIATSVGQEAHRIATNLRPTALDDLGLDSALRHCVAEWAARNRVRAEYDRLGNFESRLPSHVETTLYRAVQEALTNVAKHAAAAHVSVILDVKPDEIHVIVEDDGSGCDPHSVFATASATGRLGLVGMRERVELHGGGLQLESSPSGGTTIFIRIPLERRSAAP